MTVQKTFANANPPYNVEILLQGVLGDVIARVDTNQDGRFEDWIQFFDSYGGWDIHLVTMLREAGRTDIETSLQATLWIQSRPRSEVDALLKPVWNAVCKLIAAIVNKTWKRAGTAPPANPVTSYVDAESVFAGLMAQTVHSEDAEGKAVLTLP